MRNIIPVGNAAAGDLLTLEFIPRSEWVGTEPYSILLGKRSSVMTEYLSADIVPIFFTVVLIVCAVVMLVTATVTTIKKLPHKSSFFLPVLVIVATMWLATDKLLYQYISSNTSLAYFIFIFSFLFMSVPAALYFSSVFERYSTVFRSIAWANTVYSLFRIAVYLIFGISLEYLLSVTHLWMAAILVTALVATFTERRKMPNMWYGAAVIVFSLIELYYLVDFYVNNRLVYQRGNYSSGFYIGILVFIVLNIVAKEAENFADSKTALKADYFRQCAFTDALTGVSSRLSYESYIDGLEKDFGSLGTVAVLIADLNNLKTVNNRYGHAEGDRLICGLFNILHDVFGKYGGVFRTGGDEAAVILPSVSPDTAQTMFDDFHDKLAKYNNLSDIPIDVAVGTVYESTTGEKLRCLRDVIRSADSLMYADKKRIKAAVHAAGSAADE